MPLQHSSIKKDLYEYEEDFLKMWNLKRSQAGKDYIITGITGEKQEIPEEFEKFVQWTNNLGCGKFHQLTVNWYTNGEYYIDEHTTKSSKVVIISFGATRIFRIKRNSDGEVRDLNLLDGDVFAMTGSFQEEYKYEIPKQVEVEEPTISLTFYKFDNPVKTPVKVPVKTPVKVPMNGSYWALQEEEEFEEDQKEEDQRITDEKDAKMYEYFCKFHTSNGYGYSYTKEQRYKSLRNKWNNMTIDQKLGYDEEDDDRVGCIFMNEMNLQFYSKSKDDLSSSPTFDNPNIPLNWRKHLSNYWEQPIKIQGLVYPSGEHYFHAMKVKRASNKPDEFLRFTIHGDIKSPSDAKKAGGKGGFKKMGLMLDFDKWNKVRDDTQREIIEARYRQHPVYKEVMDEAKKKGAVFRHFERSGEKSYWGGHVSKETGEWVGGNRLGILMTEYLD